MVLLLLAVIYMAFISLGLPDALLGSAWPSMYPELNIPVSYAGMISMIISCGTITSSLLSQRLSLKLGPGKLTAISVGITAFSLFGFALSGSFMQLCLWALPYGLGAGSVDACLNNYVALHYKSKHMNWLHCMWGIGASAGPYIMGYILSNGGIWQSGYRVIGMVQLGLTALLFLSLPLWKATTPKSNIKIPDQALKLREILAIAGVKEIVICFFCYCAIEQTAGLWAASYLHIYWGVSAQTAASFAGMFYLGITFGRALAGFIAIKLADDQLIWLGGSMMFLGMIALALPVNSYLALGALVLIGLGCAPVYPAIIHSTPERFGSTHSQAIIGLEMACAYIGSCLMPVVFGVIASRVSVALFPLFLLLILLIMLSLFYRLVKTVSQ